MDSTASSEVAQLSPDSPSPSGEVEWPDCERLVHFFRPNSCIYCHDFLEIKEHRDVLIWGYRPCALLYCKDAPIGTWKLSWETTRDVDFSMWRDEGICWCGGWDAEHTDGLIAFHQDCFAAIDGADLSAERTDRLGRACSWTDIRHLGFDPGNQYYLADIPNAQNYRHDSISSVGQKLGLSLDRLPLETLRHIQSYCRDAPFWKMVKTIDFTTYLDMGPRTKMLSTTLASVAQWTRGSTSPVLSPTQYTSGHVRITIDRQGFCEIEQLSEYPRVCLVKRPYKRFIILQARHAVSIKASFKDGMCWLGLQNSGSISTIWDIPTPPDELLYCVTEYHGTRFSSHPSHETCSMMGWSIPGNILETVSLDNIGGLTVGLTNHGFEMEAYNKPSKLQQVRYLKTWSGKAYMPIGSNDSILWIQVRRYDSSDWDNTSILVKTKLSGVIHLGHQGEGPGKIVAFSKFPRVIFHHPSDRNTGKRVAAIHPKSNPSPDHEVSGFANIGPPVPGSLFITSPTFWSWAPLQDIASVHVFMAAVDGSFVGMHITYKNGGQRFVGNANRSSTTGDWLYQAREVQVENPTRLYVEIKTHLERHQKVKLSVGNEDALEKSELWEGYDLVGELHYWYQVRGVPYRGEVQVLPSGSWRGLK
ncbi:hypothetical protein FLAG1_06636 [Fusarium langsethiae]|uniref:Uncharacterized protein n=1 Tax=Fusarium langsethiae TaxID=179993 RepID=A0A0N0DE18_FUSLA|nr:hypothetical protein FLAG1_06636 [Fusarium langsethiae]GKU02781.1 unnamed protein product [Fusarium langsethiae]GKU18286.1 unnamed protein product [Fusarium langsethiae]